MSELNTEERQMGGNGKGDGYSYREKRVKRRGYSYWLCVGVEGQKN